MSAVDHKINYMQSNLTLDVWLLFILLIMASTKAFAVPSLSNLTEEQASKVALDFGRNFVHTTVTPASGLKGFGIELGAIAGLTRSKGINDIVEENFAHLPHAGAMGVFYMPAGFGIEGVMIPKTVQQGLAVQSSSGALRWTPTEIFSPNGFISLRLRGFYGDSRIGYTQTISNVPVDIKFTSISSGADLAVSFQNIPFIEPYVVAGLVNLSGQLGATGSISIFDSNFTTSQEARFKTQTQIYTGGLNIKLPFLSAGAEYSLIGGEPRYTVKLAFQITPHAAKARR